MTFINGETTLNQKDTITVELTPYEAQFLRTIVGQIEDWHTLVWPLFCKLKNHTLSIDAEEIFDKYEVVFTSDNHQRLIRLVDDQREINKEAEKQQRIDKFAEKVKSTSDRILAEFKKELNRIYSELQSI